MGEKSTQQIGASVLTRRNLLTVTGLAAIGAALGPSTFAYADSTVLASVGPLKATGLNRVPIPVDHIVDAIYGNTLAPIVNAEVIDGPLAGWMTGTWWRETTSTPENARNQELVAVMAYFLYPSVSGCVITQYANDPDLKARLREALEYYLSLQNHDGSFPEATGTGDGMHMASTGFGCQALGMTYGLIQADPEFADLLGSIRTCLYRAVNWLLNFNRSDWIGQISFTNQWIAAVSGAVAAAKAVGGVQGRAMLRNVPAALDKIAAQGFSPAGHTIEAGGFDFAYSMQVALPDLGSIAENLPDSLQATCRPKLIAMAAKMVEFSTKAAPFEPTPDIKGGHTEAFPFAGISVRNGSSTFATEIRRPYDMVASMRWLMADVKGIQPFSASREDQTAWAGVWQSSTDPLASLAAGDTSPARLWRIPGSPDGPLRLDREEQIKRARYLTSNRYNDISDDVRQIGDLNGNVTGLPRVVGFVRRPGFYAGVHFGNGCAVYTNTHATPRFGLGLIWTPDRGAVLSDFNVATVNATHGMAFSSAQEARVPLFGQFFDQAYAAGNKVSSKQASALTSDFSYVSTNAASNPSITTTVTFTDQRIIRTTKLGSATATGKFDMPLILTPGDHFALPEGVTVTGATLAHRSGQLPAVENVAGLSGSFTINGGQFSIVTGNSYTAKKRITVQFSDAAGKPVTSIKVTPLHDYVMSTKKSRVVIEVPVTGQIGVNLWFQP